MKNIKTIASLASNPWVLGAVGIGAIAWALSSVETDAEQMERVLGSLDANLSPEARQNITDGINAGIEAARKDFAIEAKAKVTLDGEAMRTELQNLVNDTLDDGELSFGEYSSWQAYVTGKLAPDAAAGMQHTATAGIAAELSTAIDDMNALLEVVYRAGNSATAQEIADLETAIAKVQALHEEMDALRAEIEAGEAANVNTQGEAGQVVAKGLALKGQAAKAVGFTSERNTMLQQAIDAEQKEAEQIYTAAVAAAETEEEIQAAKDELAAATQAHEEARKDVTASVTGSYAEQWAGLVKQHPEAWAQLQPVSELLDMYSAVLYMVENDMDASQLRGRIPAGALGRMGYQQFEDGEGNPLADVPLENLLAVLPNRIEAAYEGAEDNPLIEWVQAMIDRGVDPASLDTGALSQDMADVLRLVMAMQDKDNIGTEAMESLSAGMKEGAEGVEETADEIGDSVENSLAAPAKVARGAGQGAADNLADGLAAGTPAAAAAAARLAGAVSAALQFVMPGAGIATGVGTLAAGSVTNNNSTDNSVNVTIQSATMGSTQQANNLADRLAAYGRMKNAGVGLNN